MNHNSNQKLSSVGKRYSNNFFRMVSVALCILGIFFISQPSLKAATEEEHVDLFSGYGEVMIFGAVLYGAFDVVTLTYSVGNIKGIAEGEKPGNGWRIGGWVTGLLNVGLGAYLLAIDSDSESLIAFGVGHLALGVLDIGLAEWAATYPTAEEKTKLSLSPMMLKDSTGNPAFGFGVKVVGW